MQVVAVSTGAASGWLEKQSGGHKGFGLRGKIGNMKKEWNRRYFTLGGQTLKCAPHQRSR
jgi:hypothetical protein